VFSQKNDFFLFYFSFFSFFFFPFSFGLWGENNIREINILQV
jgi:hypothetical protein